jgi:methyl-accepting chemotaxis protein
MKVTTTRPLTRADIAELAKSPRQQRFLESLGQDAAENIPSAVNQVSEAAALAQAAANAAQAAADAAQAAAQAAQSAVDALAELVGVSGMDSVPAVIGSMQADIQAIAMRVAAIEEGPP